MAGAPNYQTVRLARGRHRSPAEGACVMELASMLAGEPFSDRPRCVDPVLAAYLRALNDRLDARRRLDLRPYASAVIGTSGDRRATRARRRRCVRAAGGRLRIALRVGVREALSLNTGPAIAAARASLAIDPFPLLDELLGAPPTFGGNAAPPNGVTEVCAASSPLPSLS